MKSSLIFIVEDDAWYADLLEYNLKMNPDYTIEKFTNAEDCLQNLYKQPMAITLDYRCRGIPAEKRWQGLTRLIRPFL